MSESLPLCSLQFYSNYPSIFFHKTQHRIMLSWTMGFLDSSDRKESACNGKESSLGRKDPLEKGMVIHSSIVAWRIPCRKEPGRL